MPVNLETIRVLIADDHAVVREGIRHVLGTGAGFDVIGEAIDGRRAVELARDLRPHVVVLDLSMPVMSGLDACAEIRAQVPDARILVLSIHDHDEYVSRAVRCGAHGYLRKDSSPAELRAAVRAIHEGGTSFSTSAPVTESTTAASESVQATKLEQLTSREREVLLEIARGCSNKEIASRFGLSVRTVESHREAIMRKLAIRGTAALTRFAIDHGMVE